MLRIYFDISSSHLLNVSCRLRFYGKNDLRILASCFSASLAIFNDQLPPSFLDMDAWMTSQLNVRRFDA